MFGRTPVALITRSASSTWPVDRRTRIGVLAAAAVFVAASTEAGAGEGAGATTRTVDGIEPLPGGIEMPNALARRPSRLGAGAGAALEGAAGTAGAGLAAVATAAASTGAAAAASRSIASTRAPVCTCTPLAWHQSLIMPPATGPIMRGTMRSPISTTLS